MYVNIIAFQIGWFACVLGGANHLAWLGTLVAMVILTRHIVTSENVIFEFRLITIAMIIGLVFDSIPQSLGWITFAPVDFWPDALPPPWMIILWGLFASTMNISLSWLKTKFWLALILGATAGPITYWSGSRFGALQLVQPLSAMIYLSLGWALAVPTLLKIASFKNTTQELKQ
jgi:hypothetical protein